VVLGCFSDVRLARLSGVGIQSGSDIDFAVEMASDSRMPLDADNVRDALRLRVPALNATREAHREVWTELPPNNYAIFGEILRPHLFRLLRSPENERELQDIFSFLEEVARADSSALSDVLRIEIVNPLVKRKAERELASKYMGSTMRELARESEKWSLHFWLARLLSPKRTS
jgi:hypothetical protein